MNVETTRLRSELCATFPVTMSTRDGHPLVLPRPTLLEAAVTLSTFNSSYGTPVVNPTVHTLFLCVCAPPYSETAFDCGLGGCVASVFVWSLQPAGGLLRMAAASSCSSTRSSLSRENTTCGTLSFDCAATIRLIKASRTFSQKKNWREWRYHAVSRWILCVIKVFNQPLSDRGHHWLHNLPLLRHLSVSGTFAWPSIRGTSPWVFVTSGERAQGSSCSSRRMCFLRWTRALVCWKPRVTAKQR